MLRKAGQARNLRSMIKYCRGLKQIVTLLETFNQTLFLCHLANHKARQVSKLMVSSLSIVSFKATIYIFIYMSRK